MSSYETLSRDSHEVARSRRVDEMSRHGYLPSVADVAKEVFSQVDNHPGIFMVKTDVEYEEYRGSKLPANLQMVKEAYLSKVKGISRWTAFIDKQTLIETIQATRHMRELTLAVGNSSELLLMSETADTAHMLAVLGLGPNQVSAGDVAKAKLLFVYVLMFMCAVPPKKISCLNTPRDPGLLEKVVKCLGSPPIRKTTDHCGIPGYADLTAYAERSHIGAEQGVVAEWFDDDTHMLSVANMWFYSLGLKASQLERGECSKYLDKTDNRIRGCFADFLSDLIGILEGQLDGASGAQAKLISLISTAFLTLINILFKFVLAPLLSSWSPQSL